MSETRMPSGHDPATRRAAHLSGMHPNIETIYVAASEHDGRFTRICVASIRHFHPDVRIVILQGGNVEPKLLDELKRYWEVETSAIPAGRYGWGFVKLEPLFRPPGERFLMLDSDTVFAGPMLDMLNAAGEQFVINLENPTIATVREIYWNPDEAIKEGVSLPEQPFYFNTGQWVGTSGVLIRDDFADFIDWSMPSPSFATGE